MNFIAPEFGVVPPRTRKQLSPQRETISYAIGECALGRVLVARSDSGVCAILIGSDARKLKQDLAVRFPGAKLKVSESIVRKDLAKVLRFADKPANGLDLQLDLRGTPFQRRVWKALCGITIGTTVSYSELARKLGSQNSTRAVAAACASNPIALAVPCHRVVRSDGGLARYRWGVERKRQLLEREAKA